MGIMRVMNVAVGTAAIVTALLAAPGSASAAEQHQARPMSGIPVITWQNKHTGLCLYHDNLREVSQSGCNANDEHVQWIDDQDTSGDFTESAVSNGGPDPYACLNDDGNGTVNLSCLSGRHLTWSEIHTSSGWVLQNQDTEMCLTVVGYWGVIDAPCDGSDTQLWG
ncbi:hypothetical protein AB5J72_36545 [Streptomyces sp. CG1]|uniref:RICIN domain-containing protein n=1 Tax=Streptomyces sp. CG1 TaxID=1287523 RepID=UPI0034E2FFA9